MNTATIRTRSFQGRRLCCTGKREAYLFLGGFSKGELLLKGEKLDHMLPGLFPSSIGVTETRSVPGKNSQRSPIITGRWISVVFGNL